MTTRALGPAPLEGFDAVEEMLAAFPWLNALEGISDLLVGLILSDTPPEAIAARIRETPQYKARFPGMAGRVTGGFGPITEAEYLELEDSYRNLFREYGLLGALAPNIDEFRKLASDWIAGDISATEMSRRLDAGYAVVRDSGALVKQSFQQFYGIEPTDEQLLLYSLDPDRGLRDIENQVQTSLIGGEALRYGLNINRTRTEMLREAGVTREMARTGFADVARELPQLKTLAQLHSRSPLSQADLENFVFHDDPEILRERFRVFESALSEFSGGAPSATTAGGVVSELIDLDPSV